MHLYYEVKHKILSVGPCSLYLLSYRMGWYCIYLALEANFCQSSIHSCGSMVSCSHDLHSTCGSWYVKEFWKVLLKWCFFILLFLMMDTC